MLHHSLDFKLLPNVAANRLKDIYDIATNI